ncbi:MAG TPA: DHA2 family efflux MFS transporter permease subunit [Rhizomicrobium sp.]|nr:DHA2 family efflux MFS transporter permease subunit [Rhizomicrobium sp.]
MAGVNPILLWLGFLAMCVGLFMAILDIQVVASALTTIGVALHIAPQRLGWIQTGYLMAEVIAIPLTGVLTRALSLRWMFVSATLGFTLASLGCALSASFATLVALRVVQGFCGGMLIPAVFTSIFVMMPKEREILATTLAGMFAVSAPTIGPFVGGYLTQHFSWNWIFLVNILPGLLVCLVVGACVRADAADWKVLKNLDYATLFLAAFFLGSLQLLLNEAPGRDWRGAFIFSVAALCAASGAAGVWRALTHATPFIDLRRFQNRAFSLGSSLSFVFGMGLYGSVYILALFLGLVRGHDPLVIGEIMMVSGAAQLVTAPLAALLESRMDARLLTAIGFALFGLGLLANGLVTPQSDFWGLFWPQILRGLAVMLCILPATRLALEGWPAKDVPDASGLFNLMRNLGGAIGIALIDTLVETRTAGHAAILVTSLQAGDASAARLVGLPTQMFRGHAMGPVDEMTKAIIAPMVQRAALTQSLNESWLLLAVLFGLALLMVPMIRVTPGLRR